MSKADKQEGQAVAEAATKATKVRKGTVAVNAKGVALIKYNGGGGKEIVLNPELIDDFAVFGFQAFFKQLIGSAKDVADLQEKIAAVEAKMVANEFPVVEKVRKSKPDFLVQAIAEVQGVSVERVEAWLAKQDRATKLAVRRDPAVATVLARLSRPEGQDEAEVKSVFDGLADSL